MSKTFENTSLKASVKNVVENAADLPNGTRVYLFGSACYRQRPQDIDILIVYDEDVVPSRSAYSCFQPLSRSIEDAVRIPCHPTVISIREINNSRFIERVEPTELRRT